MTAGTFPTTPGFLEGQIAAVGALPDVHLVIDGPGCNAQKVERIAAGHDLYSTLMPSTGPARVHYSNLLDVDFVFGTEGAVERTVADLVAVTRPALVLLAQHSIPILMGTDAAGLALQLSEHHRVPVVEVPSNPIDGDFVDGYTSVLEALARALPLRVGPGERDGLALVGYFYGRHEMDHRADVQELLAIATALELPVRSCWLDGGGLEALADIGQAGTIIGLPHGGAAARLLAERLDIPWHATALPIGVSGTARWIRQLARICGREPQAEAYISAHSADLFRRLEWVIPEQFAGRQAAVVADPAHALGLVDYLLELGFVLTYVGVHSRDPDSVRALASRLEDAQQPASVVIDPKRPELLARFSELQRRGQLDLVLASGNERSCSRRLGLPQLELGYPSYQRHAIYEAPVLGFRGALWLADALFNLLGEAA